MAKDDKMTRDIRNTLRKTFGRGGRYATGTAKLFLASGKEYFAQEMPAPVAMWETNKDILTEFWRSLRNPSDAANRYGNRISEMESYKELKKFAKNALDDLKTGKLYDKDRDRSSWGMEIDNLMDNFGGFDMTGFDENGDWSEDDVNFDEIDAQIKLAEAQENGAARRTEATIDAIGTGTEAIVRNQQAIASNELRIGMKQHSQMMTAMQNMITQQATSVEMQAKSINALLDVTREAHNQMLESVNKTNDLLAEIRDLVKPPEDRRREYNPGNQPIGYNGEINIKEYAKHITKNVKDKFLFGGGLSTFTGGFTVAQVLDAVQNNPFQLITDLIVPQLVPKDVKAQMKRTNRNIGSFLPALFTKMADRGKRFERGESERWQDALMGIFGIEQKSSSSLSPEREDYLKAAKFTDKTTRAIEEVIPMLLSKIDSSLTGGPLMVYDYKRGKFVKAASVIADAEYNARDLAGKGGETTWKMMGRASKYKFRTTQDAEQFQQYMYTFLQKMAEESRFIDKNMSKTDFMKMMPSVKNVTAEEVTRYGGYAKWNNDIKQSQYADMILAILKNMDSADLQEMSRNMISARAGRDRAVFDINKSNEETGLGAAWSGLLDASLQEAITDATRKKYGGLTEQDIDKITESKRSDILKTGGTRATHVLLNDILTTLRGGIITYSYHMGRIKEDDVTSGNSVLSKQAKEALGHLEAYRAKEEERLENLRKEEEQRKADMKKQMDEYNKNILNPDRKLEEMYSDALPADMLGIIQSNITLEEYNPDDPKLKKEKELREKYSSYEKLTNKGLNKIKDKTGKLATVGEKFRQLTRTPFELFNKGMQLADAFMLKALYGDDINVDNFELWQGRDGEPFLFKTLTNALNVHFKNAKNWFVENIGDPLKDYFFNKEDGLIPKLKESLFDLLGVDEKKEWVKGKYKEYRDKAITKIRGTKNADGQYEGGWFSNQFNQMSDVKNGIKGSAYSSIQNSINRLLYGDLVDTKGTTGPRYYTEKVKVEGSDAYYMKRMRRDVKYSGVIGRLKQGFQGLQDFLFGDGDNELNPSESKKKFDFVRGELSKAFPNMVVGAGAGMLASLFLPGGPLLGAIIGSTGGLIKSSDNLQKFLFGDVTEETIYDKDGNPVIDPKTGKPMTKKSRKGNLISKDVYEGFSKFAPKVAKGAIIGKIAGGLGLLPFGLGSTAGMVVGSMAGMIGASDQMKKLIFGKEGDDDSGLISKNFRKSVVDWAKKNLPTTLAGALGGAAAWGLISNVGLLPGLAMLPGGPILGFLGASIGLANADNIKDFFFGESKTVTDPETGEKTTQRQGGVFGKAFDSVRDKIMTPIAKSFNFAGEKTKDWFQENIVKSFENTVEPMKQAFKNAATQIETSMINIGDKIVEAMFGRQDDPHSIRYKFHDFWDNKVMGKLKQLPNKIFGAIGKVIGTVISAPFKVAEFMFNGTVGGKTLDQIKFEKKWKKRNKAEWESGEYGYVEDEDSVWGIRNMFTRAKKGIRNAFSGMSSDEYRMLQSGMTKEDLIRSGKASEFSGLMDYFNREEAEGAKHKTRSAMEKLQHDTFGMAHRGYTLGLNPSGSELSALGIDDRIANSDWGRQNLSKAKFLEEGGVPDAKAYQLWANGKISIEKRRMERNERSQRLEDRNRLTKLRRDYNAAVRRARRNGEDIPKKPEELEALEAKGLTAGQKLKNAFTVKNQVGPRKNAESYENRFLEHLKNQGSTKSLEDMYYEENQLNPYTQRKLKEKGKKAHEAKTLSDVKPVNAIPVVRTLDPKNPEAVAVKVINTNDFNGDNNPINDTPLGDMINDVDDSGNTTSDTQQTGNGSGRKRRRRRRRGKNQTNAQMSEEAKRAAKQQQDEEARKEAKEVEQFTKGMLKEDRSNENTSNPIKANDITDKNVANAKTLKEQEGIIEAAKGNATRRQMPMAEKAEKDKESWWDKILGFLPKVGGILAAIFGGITGLLSLVGGIGAAIGAIASGAADKAMHGIEVLAQGFLKRFGFSTMNGATFGDVGKYFTNAKTAREASKDFAKASSENITKRAAKRNMASARGLNRAARFADFFESFGMALRGDKEGLARLAEDASEKGLIGGLGMRMRQGLGKAGGTGLGFLGEGISKLGTSIADSGFVKMVGATTKGEKMFANGLKYQAEAFGKYSKTGVKAGEVVGKAFNTVKEAFIKSLEKLFNIGIIKNTKFGKQGAKIVGAIKNMGLWGSIKSKFLSMGGKEAAAKISLKELHVVPVLTLGFAVADFTIGQAKAREYFGVFSGDVTDGMRFTAGIVNCLEGLIAAIPVPPVIPALVSVALSFFTGDICQVVYDAIADDDAKAELKQNQEVLQQAVDKYNKENNTNLTAGEYAKNYTEDGRKKSKMDKVNDVLSSVFGVKNADDIAKKANFSHAALGGKGRGLSDSSWGAGGKITAMSQHDPRFNKTSRVMADAGCGPTVGAMVASAYGVNVSPEQLSKDSFANGMRAADGGMNPQYFSQMAGKYGSGFGMAQGPVDSARISSNLAKGQPVVMMGKGGPYGPTTHYMVAEGLAGRGGVRMIDPNNGSRKTVSGNDLIKNSTASVYSWGRGKAELAGINRAWKRNRSTIGTVWGAGSGTKDVTDSPRFKSDLDAHSLLDDDYNTPEGKLAAFGGGRGLWGRGGIASNMAASIGNSVASGSSGGNAQVKSAIQALMGEYKSNQWTRTDSSGYGAYRPSYGGRYHAGIDLTFASNASTGRAIKSFTEGTVYRVHNNAGGRGWYIIIQDKNGYYHFYQHLNKSPTLAVGSRVGIGDTVGGYGNTGASNGNHLHYEVRPPTAAQQPGGVTGTDPGHSGFIRSKEELARYTVNPYTYLQQYMNGNIDTSALGGAAGGTTTDASGTSGTSGSIDASQPKGIQMLSAVSDMFDKFSSPFTTLIGKILNQGGDESSDSGTDASGGTSTGITGATGTTLDNAKYVYRWMKQFGVPDINIAGMLGNWTKESGIDPTGVEGIYSEPFQVGPKKQAAMADPQSYVFNSLKPRTRIKVNWNAYKGRDGVYYPGIGLGGFTGPATTDVLDIAKKNGTNWYDLETQLHYVTDPGGYRGGSTWVEKWKKQNFSSAAQSADWFTKNWEGITPSAAVKSGERRSLAQDYMNQFASWGNLDSTSSGGVSAVKDAVANKVAQLGSGIGLYGAGPGLTDTYNVESMAKNVRNWNSALKKNNVVTDISKGFNNISQISRGNYIDSTEKKTDTTAQILAFLTENIGTLIQYVATIADKMPTQRKISDVQKNINGTRTALPTVSASNMYAPTPTGNNSEDVGLRIMNSLTSK